MDIPLHTRTPLFAARCSSAPVRDVSVRHRYPEDRSELRSTSQARRFFHTIHLPPSTAKSHA